jgi:hypothetical protein
MLSSYTPHHQIHHSSNIHIHCIMRVVLLASALMSLFTTTLAGSGGQTCKEEALKCGGGNPGGAVFVCRKGRWEVLIDCGASESCINDPVPTCTWAKTSAEDAMGVTTGFEISSELVAADAKKKEAAASSAPANDKVCGFLLSR